MNEKIYNVLSKINQEGYQAYIVGGYVRDRLLNLHEKNDIDICTNAKPKEIMNIFKEYNPRPLEYGNVIININEYKYEITTFRKDICYKDNRHPDEIIYVDTLEEDIKRRDFTINTFCMDVNGKIIDILDAKKDLKQRRLKSVGPADQKLKDDALRILRAVRFATVLNFKLDKELKDAIINNRSLVKNVSYDRKKEELNKIFSSENKKYGVRLLKELKLVDELELKNIDNVLKTNYLMGMWATITQNDNYTFNKNEKDLIKKIKVLLEENLLDNKVLYKYGNYLVTIVCDLKGISKKKINNIYDKLPIKDKNEIKITAQEICEVLEKEPNNFIKEIYDDLEEKILTKKLNNDNEEIKKYIKENYYNITK